MKKKNMKSIIAIVSVVLLVLSSLSWFNIAIFAENSAEMELSAIDSSIEEAATATEETEAIGSDPSVDVESAETDTETSVNIEEAVPPVIEEISIPTPQIEAVEDISIPDDMPEIPVISDDSDMPEADGDDDTTEEQSSGTYYINYILFGGTNDPRNLASVPADSGELVKFYSPTKDGYAFAGWYTDRYSPEEMENWNVGHTLFQPIHNWALNGRGRFAYVSTNEERDYWWYRSFVPNRISDTNLDVYDDNIYVLAGWVPAQYTVTFDGNGGTYDGMEYVQNIYTYGSDNICPDISFYRKGYTFNGFLIPENGQYNDFSRAGDTAYKPSEIGDLDQMLSVDEENNNSFFVLTADWSMDTYSIQYVLNGGTLNRNPASYTVADTIDLQSVSRTGYQFAGWYTDASLTHRITRITEGTVGDLTLYAKWSPNTYSIMYNKNGGSGSMSAATGCKYNSSYKLSKNAFTKKNYTFAGWNTKADGSGTAYANGASVKNLTSKDGGKIILYAQWKLTDYKITYYLNGGKNHSNNPTTYNYKTGVTLGSPSRTGYTFAGWYTDKNYKTKSATIKQGSSGNKAFFAKWTANKYTIAYNRNGGTGTAIANQTGREYDKTYTLAKNTYKRTGYTFAGWNTKADGSGTTYKNGASVKNLTTKNGGKVTLYATWVVTKYSITYNLNGGKNASANPSYYTYFQTVTLKNPSRAGYTFAGWYSDKNFKNKVTSIAKGSKGSKTLYAKWTANKYTITYSGNGATNGTMAKTNCTYGKNVSLRTNGYTRRGYTFAGWSTSPGGGGTIYANGASVKNLTTAKNGTVTLYAQWSAVNYTITYILNGGQNASGNPSTYTINSTITLKSATKANYAFLGWYTDAACTNQITTISGRTGNLTLYAGWRHKVEVTCSKCGGYGKVPCSHCGGVGEITCRVCYGRGQWYNTITHEYQRCSACYGSGAKDCSYCFRGMDTCYTCGGTGVVWK